MASPKRIFHKNREIAGFYNKYRKFYPKIFRKVTEDLLYRPARQSYDYYFSLGGNCLGAILLKELGIRKGAGPLDWIAGNGYFERYELLMNDFRGFFDRGSLRYLGKFSKNHGTYHFEDEKSRYAFLHDFTSENLENYDEVVAKYERRIKRLYECCNGKSVLLLYIVTNDDSDVDYLSDINIMLKTLSNLKTKLHAARLDLLMCVRTEKYENYLDKYETQDGCSLYLQKYDATDHEPGKWMAFSKLNDLVKKGIVVATEDAASCKVDN